MKNKILLTKLRHVLLDQADPDKISGGGFFSAAVLIPLVEQDGKLAVLFEVRSSQLAWQPGEICFPGGRVDNTDKNSRATAIREAVEELGVEADDIEVLGELGQTVSPIGVILKPYVARLHAVEYRLNGHEVAEVFAVPLDFLAAAQTLTATMELATRPLEHFPFQLLPGYQHDWKQRRTYEVLFFEYQHRVIWGLTAQILAEFLKIYQRCVDAEEIK